ncbi:MAG: methyl-accepting chemotaxis protein [Candidatus Eisenbacteria bacterium]
MGRLTETYGLNDGNLSLRREFMLFSKADMQVLASLAGWSRTVAPAIAREFYEHQFTFGPTVEFFRNMAAQKGLGMDQLRTALERAQAGYFREIFEEAEKGGSFGPSYFEKRLLVGLVHNKINLPLKWYVGSYALYMELSKKYLRKSFPFKPGLRDKAERALSLAFNYDMQAIVDAFLFDMYRSVGVRLDQIVVSRSEHDLSDTYPQIKGTIQGALLGLSEASVEVSRASRELSAAADQLSTGVQQQASALEETAASLHEISATVDRTAADAAEASRIAVHNHSDENGVKKLSAVAAIEEINRSSKEIAGIVTLIDEIAFQTNLLALNAAVEAARAGEHGRGFAVVATEVRTLAQRSASAAREIKGLIATAITSVDSGSTLVNQVARMVEQIAVAAGEQSQGVRSINSAMGQMDQATQRSAAQAEELTATAVALSNQATRLEEIATQLDLAEIQAAATGGASGGGGHGYHEQRAA